MVRVTEKFGTHERGAYENEAGVQVTMPLEDILIIFIGLTLGLLVELYVSVLACIGNPGSRYIFLPR